MPSDFEQLAQIVCAAERQMTDEQRLQFWDVIQMSYCKHCGVDLETLKGGICYCHPSYDE